MASHEGPESQAAKPQHEPKSASELMSSAKVLADAAKSSYNKDPDQKLDTGRLAGAADDLLGAASHYGKLEEKGYGEYVNKADDYLKQYNSSGQTKPSETQAQPSVPEGGLKMAEGLLKSSGGDKTESNSSGGDYLKMAQGLFGK